MSSIMRISPSIQILYARKPLLFPSNSVPNSVLYSGESGFAVFVGKNKIRGKKVCLANYSVEGSVKGVDNLPLSIELLPIVSDTQFDRVIAGAQQLEEPVLIVWIASWCRKCIYLKPKLEKLAADYYSRMRFYCVDVNHVTHKLIKRAGITDIFTFTEVYKKPADLPWESFDSVSFTILPSVTVLSHEENLIDTYSALSCTLNTSLFYETAQKMPTIQLWKDGEKKAELIGGHKAHLVINEIREIIENEDIL